MAPILGKRKVRSTETASAAELEDAQAIFRRHFEAQFKPLPVDPPRPKTTQADELLEDDETDSDESDGGSEWGGISEDEDGDDGKGRSHLVLERRLDLLTNRHRRDHPGGNHRSHIFIRHGEERFDDD